jgi:hypothetical protein
MRSSPPNAIFPAHQQIPYLGRLHRLCIAARPFLTLEPPGPQCVRCLGVSLLDCSGQPLHNRLPLRRRWGCPKPWLVLLLQWAGFLPAGRALLLLLPAAWDRPHCYNVLALPPADLAPLPASLTSSARRCVSLGSHPSQLLRCWQLWSLSLVRSWGSCHFTECHVFFRERSPSRGEAFFHVSSFVDSSGRSSYLPRHRHTLTLGSSLAFFSLMVHWAARVSRCAGPVRQRCRAEPFDLKRRRPEPLPRLSLTVILRVVCRIPNGPSVCPLCETR